MSATITTVKELKDWLKDYPDDMRVVIDSDEPHDIYEGQFVGVEKPFVIRGYEVRTGWILHSDKHDGEDLLCFAWRHDSANAMVEDWYDELKDSKQQNAAELVKDYIDYLSPQ